ncbi:TPA: AAA family ATPase, partial [Yersinia enterocolitica]|nr:AAA family ATPase [Yersinia enterocolitica]
MKIKKVEIQAFRAYNLKNNGIFDFTLENERTSNFVAIYAPNGFGKSSFYDAVEWAITNNLERISGDYNRKNNELAANSTKQDGIGQKILRNTDAAEKTKTSVTVFTTWKNYTRTLKEPRSDSRDIQ